MLNGSPALPLDQYKPKRLARPRLFPLLFISSWVRNHTAIMTFVPPPGYQPIYNPVSDLFLSIFFTSNFLLMLKNKSKVIVFIAWHFCSQFPTSVRSVEVLGRKCQFTSRELFRRASRGKSKSDRIQNPLFVVMEQLFYTFEMIFIRWHDR